MPFSTINNNSNFNDSIDPILVQFSDSTVFKLLNQIPDGAARALVQFYLDATGIAAIGASNLGSTPIVQLSESSVDTENPAAMPPGIRMFHLSTYEVIGIQNLKRIKFLGANAGVTVFADVTFYK